MIKVGLGRRMPSLGVGKIIGAELKATLKKLAVEGHKVPVRERRLLHSGGQELLQETRITHKNKRRIVHGEVIITDLKKGDCASRIEFEQNRDFVTGKPALYLYGARTNDGYGREGMMRQVICEAINFARQRKIKLVQLSVEKENSSAIKLYTSLGFNIVADIVAERNGRPVEEYLMGHKV